MTFKKELARQFLLFAWSGMGQGVLLCGLAKNGKLILGQEDEVVKFDLNQAIWSEVDWNLNNIAVNRLPINRFSVLKNLGRDRG